MYKWTMHPFQGVYPVMEQARFFWCWWHCSSCDLCPVQPVQEGALSWYRFERHRRAWSRPVSFFTSESESIDVRAWFCWKGQTFRRPMPRYSDGPKRMARMDFKAWLWSGFWIHAPHLVWCDGFGEPFLISHVLTTVVHFAIHHFQHISIYMSAVCGTFGTFAVLKW